MALPNTPSSRPRHEFLNGIDPKPNAHQSMSRRLQLVRGVIGLKLIGAMLLVAPLAAEPRSGVIVRQGARIVFDGQNTQTETYWDGKLASTFTSGKLGAWEAYPDVGRVVIHPPPEPNYWVPYADAGLRHACRAPLRLSSRSQYAIQEQREDHNVGGDQRPLMVIKADHTLLPPRSARKVNLHEQAKSLG